MKEPALAIALTIAAVASASPAFGMELCLDADSKKYVLLGELEKAMNVVHAPPGKGIAHFISAGIAENIVKAAAQDHFHVPKCAPLAGPVFKLTPAALEQWKRTNFAAQGWKMSPESVERLKNLKLPE